MKAVVAQSYARIFFRNYDTSLGKGQKIGDCPTWGKRCFAREAKLSRRANRQ